LVILKVGNTVFENPKPGNTVGVNLKVGNTATNFKKLATLKSNKERHHSEVSKGYLQQKDYSVW